MVEERRLANYSEGLMDSTPPRPPNLSELAEAGERARERMQAQKAAAEASARRRASAAGGTGIGSRIGDWLRRIRGI
jgi:hypothetical protein